MCQTASGELDPIHSLDRGSPGSDLLAFSHDGLLLASAHRTGGIQIFDLQTRASEPIKTLPAPALPVTHIGFSPDNQTFLVCTGDYRQLERPGAATLWDCATWTPRIVGRHSSEVRHAEFDFGKALASAGADRVARVWDTNTGALRASLAHNSSVFRSLFVPNSELLFTATYEGHVWLWNTSLQEQMMRFPAHAHFISGMLLSPDESVLATSSQDGYVKFWAIENEGRELRVIDASRR